MLEVLNHPLITHKLTIMRNKETGTKDFRENLDEIAELMAYEVCRDLPVRSVDIETPMGACTGYELSKQVVIVPILRAGIGLLDGIRRLIPTAKVGTFDTELVKEFWLAFSRNMGATIHFQQMAGENSHHIIEAMFKGAGRALGQAVAIDPRFANEIPSTKGVL